MWTELLNNLELSSIFYNDFKTVQNAIYDRRRKILPELPRSLEEVFSQLNIMRTQDDFKFRGQPFISGMAKIFLVEIY